MEGKLIKIDNFQKRLKVTFLPRNENDKYNVLISFNC